MQLNTWECSKPHKGSKRRADGSDASTSNSIDVWVELPAADSSMDTLANISSSAAAQAAAAAAAGGASGVAEELGERSELGVLIMRVQANSPAARLEALLVGVYGQVGIAGAG